MSSVSTSHGVLSSFFVGEPFYNSEAIYLTPSVDGRVMLKGEFVRFADRDHVYLKISKGDNLHKVHLRDLIVDNIGVRWFLPQIDDKVIFPLEYSWQGGSVTASCGTRWYNGTFFAVGTIERHKPDLGWIVRADYIRKLLKWKKRIWGNHTFFKDIS